MATKKTKKPARPAGKVRSPEAGMSRPKGKKCGIAWKKILIFILGIVIGAAACCVVCCGKARKGFGRGGECGMRFVDGCLDLSKIKDPAKLEMIKAKYGNKDCITKEDVENPRPQMQRRMRRPRPTPQPE